MGLCYWSIPIHFAWAETVHLSHGVTVGDVTDSQAVLWARTEGPGFVHFRLNQENKTVPTTASNDFSAKALFEKLKPGKKYRYRVWASSHRDAKLSDTPQKGFFKTAPKPKTPSALTFIWSGDLGGQNVCRDKEVGYWIFDHIVKEKQDFFVGLGDMIYADNTCEATGLFGNKQIPGDFPVSQTIEDFWGHWRYNFADPGLKRLLSRTSYFSVWDDHEVINDFGPETAHRDDTPLLEVGLKAFLDYNPISPKRDKLYQTLRWGGHLEMFFLDTRRYRDHNRATDSPSKTLLGAEQKRWLIDSVSNSDATWKVVVSSVPISVPTGFPVENGRDGWSNFDQETGFEYELTQLLVKFQEADVRNLLWITTDVHFAAVYEYRALAESGSKPLRFHEAMVGPLSAGIYPTDQFDTTFNPSRLFFYAPPEQIRDFDNAKQWMSYGKVQINRAGNLRLSIVNGLGKTVYTHDLKAEKNHN
ncbi:MAG: alkaline phosphatase D family protein [Pseudomonadota bacterium]